MGLTEEDKQRIYDEEKARIEARDRIEREMWGRKARRGCIGCSVIILVVFLAAQIGDYLGLTQANEAFRRTAVTCMQCGQRPEELPEPVGDLESSVVQDEVR